MNSLLYNAALAFVDILCVWIIAQALRGPVRGKVVRTLLRSAGLNLFLGVVIAFGLGEDRFGIVRLLCYGLFAHAPIWCLAVGALLWRKSRSCSVFAVVLAASLWGMAYDAFLVEPTALEINHVEVVTEKVTKPFEIVVIADFQTDAIGDYERRVLHEVRDLRPDMILWAGDYLQEMHEDRWAPLCTAMRTELERVSLRPPLGAYGVGGNVDDYRWPEIFAGMPVEVFHQTRTVQVGEVFVTGLAMRESFRTDRHIPPAEGFHIVLGHCPNFALGQVDADLLIAGHVHGGQIRLPWIGPLVTNSALPRKWAAGATRLDARRTLIVSRGVGMERAYAPRLRFLCRPELLVIHVRPRT